jgi:hypothetical protein
LWFSKYSNFLICHIFDNSNSFHFSIWHSINNKIFHQQFLSLKFQHFDKPNVLRKTTIQKFWLDFHIVSDNFWLMYLTKRRLSVWSKHPANSNLKLLLADHPQWIGCCFDELNRFLYSRFII